MPIINATVLYDFDGANKNELSLNKGEYLLDVRDKGQGWWLGEKMTGDGAIKQGFFPGSYVDFDMEEFTVRVTHAFKGEDVVQLTLRVGDIVKVDDVADGGWYYGETADGREGWFPLSFSEEIHIGSLSAYKAGQSSKDSIGERKTRDVRSPKKHCQRTKGKEKVDAATSPKKHAHKGKAAELKLNASKLKEEKFAALKKQPYSAEAQGSLLIKLLRGENLPVGDVTGKSDPYVCFYKRVDGRKSKKYTFKSSWKEQTLDPVWMEQFQINVRNPEDTVIDLEVWDKDKFKPDDYLGKTQIPMRAYDKKAQRKWFDLDTRGRIEVELRFFDTSSVSAPTDFKHIGHMGFNADGGFDVENMQFDSKWKNVFRAAGISPSELKDPETAHLVAGIIQGYDRPPIEPHAHAPAAPAEPPRPSEACPLRRSKKRTSLAATDDEFEPKKHAPPPPDVKKQNEHSTAGAGAVDAVIPAAPVAPAAPAAPPPTLSSIGLTRLKRVETSSAVSQKEEGEGGLVEQIKGGRNRLEHVDVEKGIDLQPLDDAQADSMASMLKSAMEARRRWIVVDKVEAVVDEEDTWDDYGGDDDEWDS